MPLGSEERGIGFAGENGGDGEGGGCVERPCQEVSIEWSRPGSWGEEGLPARNEDAVMPRPWQMRMMDAMVLFALLKDL